jgi:hypothetical protein
MAKRKTPTKRAAPVKRPKPAQQAKRKYTRRAAGATQPPARAPSRIPLTIEFKPEAIAWLEYHGDLRGLDAETFGKFVD